MLDAVVKCILCIYHTCLSIYSILVPYELLIKEKFSFRLSRCFVIEDIMYYIKEKSCVLLELKYK